MCWRKERDSQTDRFFFFPKKPTEIENAIDAELDSQIKAGIDAAQKKRP
jgi:hypothetical protein